ncbi:uncharacterized protein LOC144141792 [Haemaphysalis longicornis]
MQLGLAAAASIETTLRKQGHRNADSRKCSEHTTLNCSSPGVLFYSRAPYVWTYLGGPGDEGIRCKADRLTVAYKNKFEFRRRETKGAWSCTQQFTAKLRRRRSQMLIYIRDMLYAEEEMVYINEDRDCGVFFTDYFNDTQEGLCEIRVLGDLRALDPTEDCYEAFIRKCPEKPYVKVYNKSCTIFQ